MNVKHNTIPIYAARRTCMRGVLAAPFFLSACTVGPDYQPPQTHSPENWSGLDPALTSGRASEPVAGDPQITQWWNAFGDTTLTSLVSRGLASNLDIAQAESRIRQARANSLIAEGTLYPTVDARGSATRSRSRAGTGNLFVAGFDSSWELDVFGGLRRGVETADAQVQSAIEDRRDVQVTLTAEIATAYLELRGAQRQLVIAHRNLDAQQSTLGLTQERFEAGFVSALDVANSSAQVASTTSRIPIFEAAARASIYTLALLLGQEPGTLIEELSPTVAIPSAPAQIPVGLPSELLERRPDIRRADANLHAATARIGVAVADLYPKFSLTGSVGLQGDSVSAFGSIANRFWSVGPSISWPVFHGGQIKANIELQRAAAEESIAAYKQTILTALQEVEVALVSFSKEQERRVALNDSVEANTRAVDLATQLYSAGRTDFLNVLTAQRQLLDAEDALVQSSRAVDTDLVALYKALGGGWDTTQIQHSVSTTGISSPSTPAGP